MPTPEELEPKRSLWRRWIIYLDSNERPIRRPLTRRQWAIMLAVFAAGLVAVAAAPFTYWSPDIRALPCRPDLSIDVLVRLAVATAAAVAVVAAVGYFLRCRRSVLSFFLGTILFASVSQLLTLRQSTGGTGICH